MFVIVLDYVNTFDLLLCPCMFVIVLDYVNTCDLLLCPCMFVIVLDYVNTCLYSMSEVDHMYLRPIQSQTYKDIEYKQAFT
jgi:hypothetical protein